MMRVKINNFNFNNFNFNFNIKLIKKIEENTSIKKREEIINIRLTIQAYNLFQDPVEQFLGFFATG